jgi:hypothetical protein
VPLSAEVRSTLLVDGAAVVAAYLSAAQLDAIDAEIAPWLAQIAWSDVPGYALRSNDKWLDHVGVCSPTLIRVVLDEQLLDFFASIFGAEPIVAEFSIHDSASPNAELPFHADLDGGVFAYVMLSRMDDSNGILTYVPGTQDDCRYLYVPPEEIAQRDGPHGSAPPSDASGLCRTRIMGRLRIYSADPKEAWCRSSACRMCRCDSAASSLSTRCPSTSSRARSWG